jgi:ribosomal protein S18 acetylase RimI-like enzyme
MNFSFTGAHTVPLAGIVRAINLVYPHLNDTVEEYSAALAATQVDVAHSVIALDDAGHVAGMALLGVRGNRGWCGDAAVLPEYQNQKLGQELMRRLSESARRLGLRTLQLEVRADNSPARRVYEKEGYRYTRRLHCYINTSEETGWRAAPVPRGMAVLRTADQHVESSVLRWYDPRYAPVPCWERELPALLSDRNQCAWTAAPGGRVVAFLLCRLPDDIPMLRVRHLALLPEAGAEDVRALCAVALNDSGATKLRIGSEPSDSRVAAMFRGFGFTLDKDLWEMVKDL